MENQIKNISKYIDLLIVIIVIFIVPKLSSFLTDIMYPEIQGFDPDETFIYKTVHHVLQLVLTITAMILLSKKGYLNQWGFNFNKWKISLKWIAIFLFIWTTMQYIGISRNPLQLDYELTTKNKIGIQFFQYFLSGTGEEPLYRGFVMIYLMKYWDKIFKLGKVEIPISLFFATLFFMLAHVNIDMQTLSITHFDFGQQMNSFQLGIVYGLAFHYTKSLFAPIIMHGISNGIIYTIMFYLIN